MTNPILGLNDPGSGNGGSADLPTAEIKRRLTADVMRIKDAVEDITGLPSRWNGHIVADLQVDNAQAAFRPDGTIAVHPRLIYRKGRWRTLIHEICHSVGVFVSRDDYETMKGWEEGVVESMQRAIRKEVMHRLGDTYDETHIQRLEAEWLFQPYYEAMQALISGMGQDEVQFCIELLKVPVAQRVAITLRKNPKQVMALSKHLGILKLNLAFDKMNQEAEDRMNEEEP